MIKNQNMLLKSRLQKVLRCRVRT